MSRWIAYGFGLALCVAVASPALGDGRDSYPLSTYPMFSTRREKPLVYFVTGTGPGGQPVRLPPSLVANDEVMQAAATIRRAAKGSRAARARLCDDVARRVAQGAEFDDVTHVELVSARFDPIGYFVEGPVPEDRTVHARCAVERRR